MTNDNKSTPVTRLVFNTDPEEIFRPKVAPIAEYLDKKKTALGGYNELFRAERFDIVSAKEYMTDSEERGGECLIIRGKINGEAKQILIYRDEMDGAWNLGEVNPLLFNFPLLYRGPNPETGSHYYKLTVVAKYPEPHEYYVVHESYKQDRINSETMKFMEYVPKETSMERVNFDPALEDESIPEDFPPPVSWDIFPAAAVLRDPAPEGSCLVMHGKHDGEWKFVVIFREAKYGDWVDDEIGSFTRSFDLYFQMQGSDKNNGYDLTHVNGGAHGYGYRLSYAPDKQSPLKCEARLLIYSEPEPVVKSVS